MTKWLINDMRLVIMQKKDDILGLLREETAQAARQSLRGLILQPGAIGDCILTLPLAKFMKDCLGLGTIDVLGHTEYIGILPGRTCVDGIRSIDSLALHRLFADTKSFDLTDGDPLINAFADYAWIATFLGEPNSSFEQNLIFTANCSHSAEVITLSAKAPEGFCEHISIFHSRQFTDQTGISLQQQLKSDPAPARSAEVSECLIKATEADIYAGKELLKEINIDPKGKIVVIQPGSGSEKKSWHIDNFLAVAKQLIRENIQVIFLLGPAELDRFSNTTIKTIKNTAKCLTNLSLTQVLALLSCADAFLGNDSGITHLAVALGIRTLAVFGPSNPAVYKPIGPDVIVFASKAANFTKKPSPALQKKLLGTLLT